MGLFSSDPGADDFESHRKAMVDRLVSHGRITDSAVADALRAVPRHEFVPEGRRKEAYADRPLPIGDGQTISAPHMVGIMAELIEVDPGDDVLEIGTGCGYHAAVTAELIGEDGTVYSVEYSDVLAERARATFDRLGYEVEVRIGDGRDGWPEHAPFDAAYFTCAAADLPDPVVEQTRVGGHVLAPIGTSQQTLYRHTKREDGTLDRESHGGVRFVQMR
ncbi:protein-L-isoaspartate O-methyltransferase [Salinarchaeum sp. Harcht-Bsk1]|uniref:protein-L-isoaspartate(D-aspartate) O-methyltransferase n=1 Tax=Salinarchaeum sp. Harcht-Bsk1 TaxID=1333523 RepID=UPI00034231D8|nr:protein-L-isoaspartate(D-aspartate) O-methyltransferase [Salinarchaeum sp. Harcht-Bsk1]AGN02473.1 protein-L-isoaspartate O-methyltransferase [Salinarchaeum sp. Harcht-Bsk1]